MRKVTLVAFLLISCLKNFAQRNTDSCSMEISLLTVAPGEDLYSIFGHTAIRVRDSVRGMDVVYNYGTFDDTDPNFYIHFTRGIMNYSLSAETFSDFNKEYQFEKREVKEQLLNLSCAAKKSMYEGLRLNAQEENRIYQYHFHTDNCTTRAGKFIATHTGATFKYKNILPNPGPSFRDMIHEYLDKQYKAWDKFGIDMMLGANLDIKPTNEDAIYFLPDYLYKGMDSALNGGQPIVAHKQVILEFKKQKEAHESLSDTLNKIFTPLTIFLSVFLIFLFASYSNSKKATRNQLILDILFFCLLGVTGLLMLSVWIGRVDNVCRDNINILWALPTHLFAVFFIKSKKSWVRYYFLITALIACILLIGFPWWTQRMNTAVVILLVIIIIRSYRIYKIRSDAKKTIVQGPAS